MNTNVLHTDLIVIIDRNGKILYYNNFNDQINKLNNSDTIGKHIGDIYPWVNNKTPLFRVMREGQPILNEIFDITIDGNTSITAVNSAYPLKNEKGIIGAIGLSVATNQNDINRVKRQSGFSAKYSFEDLITEDKKMKTLIYNLKKSSSSNSNIFIFGESGTGKELFAHSIHNSSPRFNKPFIAQNCGAIPEHLMESTFFGTVKGSFTGSENKRGLLDIANKGTLFLDEINSMPLNLQPKLLRFIEDGTFRRVGGTSETSSDIRIISASNISRDELLSNNLRADLFYRLGVVNIEIPPLRKRIKDIDTLSNHFIPYFNNIFNKHIIGFEKDALDLLFEYDWPGNVRELRNVLESCYNIADGNQITFSDIPYYLKKVTSQAAKSNIKRLNKKNLVETVEGFEKDLIIESLTNNNSNIVKTSKELGIPRQTLYYKLSKHDIKYR